jgi:glucose/arabinose dehydrogenase
MAATVGRGLRVVAAGSVLGVALALGLAGGDSRAVAGAGGVGLRSIGTFDSPVYVANAPRKPRLLFVVEQPGTIAVLRKHRRLRRPLLDIRSLVQYGGEEGLLSVAFHPRYRKRKNRRFFVYYVTNAGNLQVDRFKAARRGRPRAKPRSRRTVLTIPHPTFANHNAGQLQFGPGRDLFIATGDGGGAGDPGENAQDPGSLLGKLLRIHPRRKRGYRIPRSNPFVGRAGRDEIYALGLRNPYRFSFDRRTADISIGDVGQASWEEIDHETLASARGANFGWDNLEGNHPFEAPFSEPPNYRAPIHEYPTHVAGTCAVTGGYVVRNRNLRSLAGRYVYADFCRGELRSLHPDVANPAATDAALGLEVPLTSSFGEGRRGRLYVASLNGPVYRIAPR